MATVNFQAPTDYGTEQADIERRRKYAEILQQQSMEPLSAPPTPAGGFAVPISPWAALAKGFQAYSAKRSLADATADQKALAGQYNTERGAALAAALRAGTGTPAQTVQQAMPTDQEGTGAFDMAGTQGPATQPVQQPAVPGNRQAMIAALTGSKFPDLQQAGMTQALAEAKPFVVGKSLMDASGRVIGSDPAWQQEQEAARVDRGEQAAAARVEAEKRAKEAADLKRELQQNAFAQAEAMKQFAASNRQPQAVTTAVVMDPTDPTRQLSVDARTYRGGSTGSPGVIGVSGKLGDAQKLENKRQFNMQGIGATIQEARDLLTGTVGGVPGAGTKPTSSGIGAAVDVVGGVFGKSPSGAVPAAQLKAVGGSLVSKMPRMEGPQSDKDVVLYKEMAGKVGDATVPIDQRTAALDVIEKLWSKYERLNPSAFADRRAGGDEPPAGAVRRLP